MKKLIMMFCLSIVYASSAKIITISGLIDENSQFFLSLDAASRKGTIEIHTFKNLEECPVFEKFEITNIVGGGAENDYVKFTFEKGTLFIPKLPSKQKVLYNNKPIMNYKIAINS